MDKERRCRIADAMNTHKFALQIIFKKGYKVFLVPDEREEYLGDYWAVLNDRDFIAGDPLRLLGLINIWEEFGDDWQKGRNKYAPKHKKMLLNRALPDSVEDYEQMTKAAFEQMTSDYELLFDALWVEYPEEAKASPQAFYDFMKKHFYM